MHIPKHFRRKLDSLSKPGILIGYEANSKAYRVLLDDGKITVSRDVIFDEAQKHITADPAPSTTLLIEEESDLSGEDSDTESDASSETSKASTAHSEADTIPSEAAATGSPTSEGGQFPNNPKKKKKKKKPHVRV